MAQEIVGFKLVLDGKEQVIGSIGEMKKLLKEANFELLQAQQNFGEYSQEAINAAKKVATLKDTIQEAGETAQLFDPGKKFQAFAGAISAVAGGFSAVQGALGLLGVESKDVEKSLLRVQSALALSQGLSTIADSAKDFQRLAAIVKETSIVQGLYNFVMKGTISGMSLQNAITKATAITMNFFKTSINGVKTASITTAGALRVLRGVVASLGIGALIFGVTALIDKIISWTSASDKAAEAQKKLAAQTDLVNAKLNNEIAVLTSLGGKEDEIFRKRVEIANNELNVLRASAKQKNGFTQEELKRFGELKTQLVTLELDEKNRIKKINEDAQKEKEKKDKEAADKAKAIAQERLQANIEAEGQIRKLRQDAELNAIEDQNKRAIRQAEIDFENRKLEIEALKANEQLKTQLITEEQKKRDLIIADLKNEAIQAELTAIIDGFAAQEAADKAEEERRKAQQQKEFDDLFAQLDRETKAEQAYSDAKKKIAEEEARVRIENTQKVAGILTGLSDLFGKETAAGKATAIAAATINTYLAASQALTGIKKLNPIGATIAIAQAALVIANGLKQVREIAKVKVPNGGGAVSVPAPISQSAGGVAPISPQAPVTATFTQLDQGTINQLGAATNRAYVVETDITNSQERIRRINRAARLE